MAVKSIVKIWDDDKLIVENINFLHRKTRPVKFPLSDNSKTIIQRVAALTPQSVKDEVEMRKKRMRAVIDGKEKFVCDDIWKKLDLKKIHADYEKRMGY